MSSRKPPKNYKLKTVYLCSIYDLNGLTPDAVSEMIRNASDGIMNPELTVNFYDDYMCDVFICGFIEMTEEEKVKAAAKAKARATRRKDTKGLKEAEEKDLLRKLAQKYPEVIE